MITVRGTTQLVVLDDEQHVPLQPRPHEFHETGRDVRIDIQARLSGNAIRVRLAKLLGPKGAQARYEAFLERAPSFIAERAKGLSGEALRTALDAYHAARELAGSAVGLSLDASGTVFEMAGLIARLAPRGAMI